MITSHFTVRRGQLSRCLIGLFCFILSSGIQVSGAAKTTTNSAQPDFAYPQTVISDASKMLKGGTPLEKVKAAIQITIAQNGITPDEAVKQCKMLDSLANELSQPYKAITYLLEANLYSEIYSSDQWKFDSRTLPTNGDLPDNPMEWNGKMMKHHIFTLLEKAAADIEILNQYKISSISGLLQPNEKKYDNLYPTVGAFVTLQINSLRYLFNNQTDRIPFGARSSREPSDFFETLVDNQIKYALDNGNPASAVEFTLLNADYQKKDRTQYLLTQYKSCYAAVPEGVRLIENLSFDNREVYDLLEEAASKFANTKYGKIAEESLCRRSEPYVSYNCRNQYLTSDSITVTVHATNSKAFYLQMYALPDRSTSEVSDILKKGKLISERAVNISEDIPFKKTLDVNLANPGAGYYAIVALANDKKLTSQLYNGCDAAIFLVSNLYTLLTGNEENGRLYVTDGHNLSPIVGATVSFVPIDKKNETKKYTTGTEGFVNSPYRSATYTVSHGNQENSGSYYSAYSRRNDSKDILQTAVLTDLSIYHPGDTVRFVGVAYTEKDGHNRKIAPNAKITASLRDANYKDVKSIDVISDETGRFTGEFVIEKDRLLGNWGIKTSGDGRVISTTDFQVAEYKAPTFYVEQNEVKSLPSGGEITISGHATTYSGMPVGNANVEIDIRCINNRFWMPSPGASFNASTVTDSEGKFKLSLSTEGIKGTEFEESAFSVIATVTSPSGESQTTPPVRFALGKQYRILTNYIPSRIKADAQNIQLKLPVVDMAMAEVKEVVDYRLEGNNGEILSGSFTSPILSLPLSKIPSGRYEMIFSLPADTTQYKASTVIYRKRDKTVPYNTSLWVPEERYIAERGATTVNVDYGSYYSDTSVLCVIADSQGKTSEQWLKSGNKMSTLSLPVPANGNAVRVKFIALHNLKLDTSTVTVYPASENDSITIETVTFRDKINSGEKENWKFKINYNGQAASDIPVMAVMSDLALNRLYSFDWENQFVGSPYYSFRLYVNPQMINNRYGHSIFNRCDRNISQEIVTPTFNYYNRSLLNGRRDMVMYKMRSTGAGANVANVESAMLNDMAFEGELKEESVVTSDEMQLETGDIPISDNEHPLAFFKPCLQSDDRGVVEIDFTSPLFNTTWQLQLAAYTPDLLTEVKKFDILASKPVMVKANYPRFLRTGDAAQISALLMNNSSQNRKVAGVIEIFDVATDKIIQRQEYSQEDFAPKSSRSVTINYDVTDNFAMIGVRCYAISENYKDGEQDIIGILPSSTPVIDATDFYLGTEQEEISLTLPTYPEEANISLNYCNNPVWFCVTALPAITQPQSINIFSQLNALFGNATASGLAKRFPQIHRAINEWTDTKDSILVSNLKKNSNITLTPWVNNAESETLRMRNLVSLFDTEKTQKSITEIIDKLKELQKADGGWSWVPQMESSQYVTGSVLLNFMWLKEMNFLPEEILSDKMIEKAIRYCDKKLYEDYLRNNKTVNIYTALNWLYVRSLFNVPPADSNISKYLEISFKKITKDWKQLDIYGKATYAILLNNYKKLNEAKSVIESLRQYAVNSSSLGMYYDNISSGWNGYTRLQTTAQVLNAFAAVVPTDSSVDKLRQWLIMQRQVQDWGYSVHNAAVIYSILTSGSEWLTENEVPIITLDSEELCCNATKLTGEFSMTFNPEDISGKTLTIKRKGNNPAWGGILAQYVSPIKDVHAASVDALSITKQIVTVDNPDAQPEKGKKVRVVLTVKNDRDLQYVAITDDRGACLEPVNQISSYSINDGVFVYRETRDTATNMFISFLPKGIHQFSYECYVDRDGTYTTGIATAESLYSPLVTAHSSGEIIVIK